MQYIPKQSHYLTCPAYGLLSYCLCGPRAKKFGDPWYTVSQVNTMAVASGSRGVRQRRADCEIFQSESSPDPIKLNPIQS